MLHELRIENLLLIERAELRFEAGLNAITGETGAGKTVLAHSLDLLMGGKARPQIVRPGAGEAYVEGVFALEDGLFDDPELAQLAERMPEGATEIVLGRRVGTSGRTSAFIQGRSASAGDLALVGARLLAFYGQHEHRKLTLASAQAEILDGFAGAKHLALREEYRAAHRECVRLAREREELLQRDGARERDLDLLRFELSEIEAAAPDPDEDAELGAERERLRHAEGLRTAAGEALGAASGAEDGEGGAMAALAQGEAALSAVRGVDPALDEMADRLSAVVTEAAELAADLRGYLDQVDVEPERLQAIEERLELVDRLQRKHGGSTEAVLAHAERCRAEIAQLENAEERGNELQASLSEAEARRGRLAAKLSSGRKAAGAKLEARIAGELSELAMPGASLEVSLTPQPEGFGASGAERVELLVATNPGMPVTPLRDTASGGELSRLMLALTGLGTAVGNAPTLVFDEIDAGIGGNTARAVGERLRDIGEGRQLICITHLPQVASVAGAHFRIEKAVIGGETAATVERVEGEELVAEICRMLGADRADEAASRHARELLAAA